MNSDPHYVARQIYEIYRKMTVCRNMKKQELLRYIDLHVDTWDVDIGECYLDDIVDEVFKLCKVSQDKKVTNDEKVEKKMLKRAQKHYDKLFEDTIAQTTESMVQEDDTVDTTMEKSDTDKQEWVTIINRVELIYTKML